MIADLKPYPKYKDSSSKWLGSAPSHWMVRSFRTLISKRSERDRPDLPLLTVTRDKGVFVRSLTGAGENHNPVPEDLSNYKVARAGDLVINKMKAWQGSMGIAPCDGIVSPAYFVFQFRVDNHAFGHMLLRSKPYVAHFAQASDGVRVGQWDLSVPGMRQIPVLIPPAVEQAAIARYLHWAGGQLERAIRTKRRIIALLNEQKQAIIHRAVTRGLDPSLPLKPSGIPWLGAIPQHWEVQRLGHVIRLQTGYPFASNGFVEGESGTRLLRGINVTPSGLRWDTVVRWQREPSDGLDEFRLEIGDIVLGMDRPIIGSGVRAATVQENDTPSLLVQRVARLRPTERLDAKFLVLLITGRLFRDYIAPIFTGVSVPHLSPEQIKRFKVPLPCLFEQRGVVSYLAAETSGLDTASSRLEREIALLREYSTRLVADVVTGKLDVREAAARLRVEVAPDIADDDVDMSDETEFAEEEAAE
jgi:type I restriction enzyme S subunit